ncbi:hypothetical protein [Deinococcus multiflagellatus]|uniref:DUF4968 domain-containing protein n=1 Tax=Deinococcus multiflagellatus TaxID=1656887 RepID=A0ABW1ZE04_9DEIO|nr:hypothetical protein [Deinococcus multiflagellatus]MBZ9712824.1 hypothetical protein [Deinococcus multiflagellatus]
MKSNNSVRANGPLVKKLLMGLLLLAGAFVLIKRPLMPWSPAYAPAQDTQRTLLGEVLGYRGPVERLSLRYSREAGVSDPETQPFATKVIEVAPDGQSARMTITVVGDTTVRTVRVAGNTVLVLDGTKVYERYAFDGLCLRQAENLRLQIKMVQTCDAQGRLLTREISGERGRQSSRYAWGWKGRSAVVTFGGGATERRTYDAFGDVLQISPAGGAPKAIRPGVDARGNWFLLSDFDRYQLYTSAQAAYDPLRYYGALTVILRELTYR